MTLHKRLIRYNDLIPCKAAFIDAKTPGSDLKDNFSIIGGGVSESTHQKVNLSLPHGFCIGAAGQPPRIKNSPHSHFTAEVFMVFSGTWRFYWNNDCKSETILQPGDIISLPTNMFRGFENVGDDYGMIFSILGRDDAGGGVVWLPEVIEEAKDHGLILLENGKLVDTTIGEEIPTGLKPMPPLSSDQLSKFDQYTSDQMSAYVGRKSSYLPTSCTDFPNQTPETITYYDIIGPQNSSSHNFQIYQGCPHGDGFNVYGIYSSNIGSTGKYSREDAEVMLVHRGEFEISCNDGDDHLNATLKDGDMMSFPKGSTRSIKPRKEGFAYLVVGEDHPHQPKILSQ